MGARGWREARVATIDEQGGTAAGLNAAGIPPTADGDDIVVIPDEPQAPRRRAVWVVIVGAIAVVAAIVGVAFATRADPAKPVTTAGTPVATTPTGSAATKPKQKPAVKKQASPSSVAPVAPVAPTAKKPAIGKAVTQGTAPVHAPVSVAPPVSSEPIKTYPPSVLQWTAPESIAIKQGTSAIVVVRATNPTNGTVTLPHSLSCVPRIDHSEVCAEVAQIIPARSNVGARYTIDATKVKPGSYTLSIEGLRTIRVTVTP